MEYALTFRVYKTWVWFTVEWLVNIDIDIPGYNFCTCRFTKVYALEWLKYQKKKKRNDKLRYK